jgi:hypothetical protein
MDPDSWLGKKSRSGSGMNIPDHISERLETIYWVKILKFFDADPDPEIFLTLDPGWEKFGSGIRDKHPVSATLVRGQMFNGLPELQFSFSYIGRPVAITLGSFLVIDHTYLHKFCSMPVKHSNTDQQNVGYRTEVFKFRTPTKSFYR